MRLEKDDAKIGLLVFLTLGLFVGFIFHRSLSTILRKETLVRVRLETASDVAEGTEVQLQGLRVGQVDAVQLQRDGVRYHFLATLGLRTDIVLWEGTRVTVVSKPLGGAYMDLLLPDPDQRRTPLAASTVLAGSSSASLASLIDGIAALVANLNHGVDEVRAELKTRGLGAVLDHPQVGKVVQSLDSTLQAYRVLAQDGQKVVNQSGGTLQNVDRTLATLNQSLDQVQGLLTSRRGDLDAIVVHLAGTLKELEGLSKEVSGVVRQTGPDADATLKSLDRTLRSTEELLELLKAKPNRLIWGKPTPAEQAAAAKKVEQTRKLQEAAP